MRIAIVSALLVLLLAPAVNAAKNHVIPANGVTTVHIRNGTIQSTDLSRQAVAWLNAGAPTPRGRGVTVQNGQHGDKVRLTGATLDSDGDLLGQITYLGGLTCSSIGPYPQVDVTFFTASGLIVDTGSDIQTSAVPNVRYPVNVITLAKPIRAEAVVSVSCI